MFGLNALSGEREEPFQAPGNEWTSGQGSQAAQWMTARRPSIPVVCVWCMYYHKAFFDQALFKT